MNSQTITGNTKTVASSTVVFDPNAINRESTEEIFGELRYLRRLLPSMIEETVLQQKVHIITYKYLSSGPVNRYDREEWRDVLTVNEKPITETTNGG